jgi:membrane-bound serine protease (ClpP class)
MRVTLKLVVGIFLSLLHILPVQANEVHVLTVQGAISPGSADYLVRGINKASVANAHLVIIELDTPGGLDTSMRDIIKAILASSVPVVTYVSPKGARAASAGTYILYASHIAAMAPATNLGAATPVEMTPGANSPEKPDHSESKDVKEEKKVADAPSQNTAKDEYHTVPQDAKSRKAVHDASAYIRSLAELRGRNAEWAERAVREAVSLSAGAALQAKVIDVVAENIDDLLKQIHERKVKLPFGEITLDTNNLSVKRAAPDWRSQLLTVIGDPSIAYILMLLGIYGLLYEFSNPGMLFPGVVGGICLLLAMFALQLMPINYVGLALIILGIALMVSEAFVPSFGAMGLGGIVAFVIGSLMLIDTDIPSYGISWELVLPIAAVTEFFCFIVVSMALRASKRPIVTGDEEMLGAEGEVLNDMQNEGWARVHSELWRIHSSMPLLHGTKVRVTARHDLILEVEAINNSIKESEHV